MLITKNVVYECHRRMFYLYEKFCDSASLPKYWQDDEDEEAEVVTNAEATNEVIDDDEF